MTEKRRAGFAVASADLVLSTVVAVAVLSLTGRTVLDSFVRWAVYPAPPVPVPSPPPAPIRELSLELDGEPLSAWWLPPTSAEAPVVLMLHGNGENLATLRWSGLLDWLGATGAGVVALDYPGYGRSAGKPSEASVVASARAAWREVVARAGSERARVAIGWSLGAAAAAQLAAEESETVDALLLLSVWTRLEEVAALHFPGWLARSLLTDRYDTLGATAKVRCSTVVVHGAADELIPAEQGRRVFDALPEPKRWREVAGAGHNDLLGRDEARHAIAAALASARRR